MGCDKKRIAVFDLNPDELDAAARAVRSGFAALGFDVDVRAFHVTRAFVEDFRKTPYDMAFMGVDSMMGVEAARLIRGFGPYCPMFFVSNSTEYGVEAFRLTCRNYLIKPLTPQKVAQTVDVRSVNMPEYHQEVSTG